MTPHWANQQEKTNRWGILFLLQVHRYFGPLPLQILLKAVVFFYWLTDRQVRRYSLQYLKKAKNFGLLNENPSIWLSFRHLLFFAQTILDKFLALTSNSPSGVLKVENDAMIMQCLDRQQGLIVLTSHMGCIERLIEHGLQIKNLEIVILIHTLHAQKLNRLLRDLGVDLRQVHFIEVTELSPISACEIETFIKRGAWVFIAGDRVPIQSNATCSVRFLGQETEFPIGGVVLANLFHCPLFSLTCWSDSKNQKLSHQRLYTARFGNLSQGNAVSLTRAKRTEEIQSYMDNFVKELEYGLKQSPLDWFNFYDFWPKSDTRHKDHHG